MPIRVKRTHHRSSLLGSEAISTRRSLANGERHNFQKVPFHGAFLEAPDESDERTQAVGSDVAYRWRVIGGGEQYRYWHADTGVR
jgi:hypothetical protein